MASFAPMPIQMGYQELHNTLKRTEGKENDTLI